MDIFQIIVYVALACYIGFNFKHDIQMLQQNSYRIGRYWRYLKNDMASAWRLTDVAMLFLLFSTLVPGWFALFLAGILSIVKICLILRKKHKKPLVFTKRVCRIYGVTLLFGEGLFISMATLITLGVIHPYYRGASLDAAGIGLITAIFSWVFVIIAVFLLKPVENAINRKYWTEAHDILKSMPDLTVVGITGSYGKTSTKHYLNTILTEEFDVLMTPGSYNTPMGVIRTVREMMKPYHSIFICEMGAKQRGDIKEICDLVDPKIGIITAVGPMHLESFKTMENVQATKFELIDALQSDGLAVINNDFEYCADRKVENVEAVRYCVGEDKDPECRYWADEIVYSPEGTEFTVKSKDGFEVRFTTRLVGGCNISNLTAAIIVALHLGMSAESVKRGVARIEQVEHRLNMKRTPGGVTIIDDAFNSNPSGSAMALEVLSGMKGGKRIVVTPGMIELGDKQHELNKDFGKNIAKSADIAIVVGQYNREAIKEGISEGGFPKENLYEVASFNEAQNVLSGILAPGDTVLYENDLPDTFK